MKFHGGVNGGLLLFPPPAGCIFRPLGSRLRLCLITDAASPLRGLLLGLLGGLSFLPALCLGRSGNVPGTAGAALSSTISLIPGGVLLLVLRRLLGFARSGLRALCLSFLRSRFGGSRFVLACGLLQPERSVQITLFKSSHKASIPASGRLPFSRCWLA